MELAKPGKIHKLCRPNAILTFAEYLFDYTTDGLMDKSKKLIREYLEQIEDGALKKETKKRLEQIAEGKRDIYF